MSETTWTFGQQFYSRFQASSSDLTSRLDSAKSTTPSPDVLQELSLDLAKLTKDLADATGSLPSYDQRQCELQLKTLEKKLEELRASSVPKTKFAFKRNAAKNSASASSVTSAPPALPCTPTAKGPMPPSSTSSGASSANRSLSSHSQRYLTAESLPTSSTQSNQSDLTISNLSGCVVNLLEATRTSPQENATHLEISALHISNLRDTVLLLPVIQGSVLLHDVSRCTVVVGCHQFRMHNSSNVDVYLSIPSNPVIEHCSGIRFAAYPVTLLPPVVDEGEIKSSNHLAVQDFSHIRSTPSPNWSAIADSTRVTEWSACVNVITDQQKLNDVLAKILAPRGS